MISFENELKKVFNDKQSGSASVLQKLIEALLTYFGMPESKPDPIRRKIPLMKKHLGHFAVVSHFLAAFEKIFNTETRMSSEKVIGFLTSYKREWANVNSGVARQACKIIDGSGKTFLLHSNSSVIVSFFKCLKANHTKVKVIQTESRPAYEGREEAKAIAGLGFEVRLITDSAAGLLMPETDYVVSGADRIGKNYFVNKTGTYANALLCREYQIPFFVLADSRKITSAQFHPADMPYPVKPPEEVWKTEHPNISAFNMYFEAIPCRLVNAFITEQGKLLPSEL